MVTTYDNYTKGQCTDYVANTASWVQQYGNLGDAFQWLGNARAAGASLSSAPVPGAVAVWGQNQGGAFGDGHVAVVTGLQGNGLPVVSEMNWTNGPFHSDTRNVPASSAAGIVGYILPPSSTLASGTVSAAQGSSGGQPVSTSSAIGGSGGWSVGPFQVLSGTSVSKLLYTLSGVALLGIGVWILFRKEIDSGIGAGARAV